MGSESPIEVTNLTFEHHPTGLGVGATPRLSWRYCGNVRSWYQTSYDIEIKRHVNGKEQTSLLALDSASSVLNAWPAAPLASREQASVRLMARGTSRTEGGPATVVNTNWSPWRTVEAALLSTADWKAAVITTSIDDAQRQTNGKGIRPIRVRKSFDLPCSGPARLYITALGVYEAYINGQRVGDQHMAPGWTSYKSRIQYQVYDVTHLLKSDQANVLAVEIAEGWYAGRLAWGDGYPCFYGSEIGVLAQLEVFDKTSDLEPSFRLVTDETWETKLSPITSSEIYDGEVYDARLEEVDWHRAASSGSHGSWRPARVLPFPQAQLVASPTAAVRITQTVRPVEMIKSPSGKTIVDFGQNLVGKVLIHGLKTAPGHEVRIRHAEVLESGELAMRPLRAAKATDTVVAGEDGRLVDWTARFTFHGFRYVDFEGWSAEDAECPLTLDSVSALVMHTDLERTGHFECSNALVNKLHGNVVWSMRGNFFSIPTDCPQRDERLGWTGDIQVFSPTASFLYNCAGMLANWTHDLVADQKEWGGMVPAVVPNVLPPPKDGQAVWDDVVVLLPWVLYNYSGDVEVLRQCYEGMTTYLDKTLPRAPDGLWNPDIWQLGDWLDPNAPPSEPGQARTDGTLVADEYLVHVTDIMAKIAGVLDKPEASRYRADAKRLRAAFQAKYVAPSGLIVGDSQTSLALALVFALHGLGDGDGTKTTAAQRAAAGARLARLVRTAHFRVSTGFAGTPVVLHALAATGHLQLAYRMLMERQCPSWLYVVDMGGTTVWERWDSMLPDGTVNPGSMTSFNHYALGAVADWLHTVVGGVRPLEPGWRRFAVEPRPGGDMTSATVEFLAPSGRVKAAWRLAGGADAQRFVMTLTVPPNTTAVVVLPCGGEGSRREEQVLGSGEYEFTCDFAPEGSWPPAAITASI
ncbi:hypothetical protein P8C59_006762 [Phyllachora maydis]|uniref:alpha-L-rhamnosidase n=1 Tax=Phyllachora maydis TaxID=1825666 RepID=A0AAD9MEV4_9PEZI|nr:hypothetical protein P8C59_006762 [Phyllachora maydis]